MPNASNSGAQLQRETRDTRWIDVMASWTFAGSRRFAEPKYLSLHGEADRLVKITTFDEVEPGRKDVLPVPSRMEESHRLGCDELELR